MEELTWASSSEDGTASRVLLRLSARGSRIPAVCVAHAGGQAVLGVPSGSMPAGLFRPRAGPIYRRVAVDTVFVEDAQQALVDEEGGYFPMGVDLVVVAASLAQGLITSPKAQVAFVHEREEWAAARLPVSFQACLFALFMDRSPRTSVLPRVGHLSPSTWF